jgi:hypothetical protein
MQVAGRPPFRGGQAHQPAAGAMSHIKTPYNFQADSASPGVGSFRRNVAQRSSYLTDATPTPMPQNSEQRLVFLVIPRAI